MNAAIFLDSASLNDVADAEATGCVCGITMNPTLLAREHVDDVVGHMRTIVQRFSGLIMYQPITREPKYFEDAQKILELAPERMCIKIPPLGGYIRTALRLRNNGYMVALTAVTSGEQAVIASAIDANYIIPYVDRAANDPRGSDNIVGDVVAYGRGEIPVVAASVKNMRQLSECYLRGAYAVSTSMKLIKALLSNQMAVEAMRSFDLEYNDV